MISVAEAKKIVHQNIQTLGVESISLLQSHGRVLAVPAESKIDVPSFDNSAMDGFAVLFDDQLTTYELTQYIQAGEGAHDALLPGQAAQIFTGAPLPKNADTVIPREYISVSDGKINIVNNSCIKGMHIRKRASQNAASDAIAKAGTYVGPGLIALLASCGIQNVTVYKQPQISYIITGNELLEPDQPLKEGLIYNSNGPAIHAYLQQCGIKSINAYAASDHKSKLREKIERALETSDMIILTGGVSAGDFDFVPEVLEELGVKKLFHKVKQKPGKPIYCGKKADQWIFGLPGNPAAVLACLNQYVKPCIMGLSGHTAIYNQFIELPLSHSWSKKPGLSHLLKSKIEGPSVRILEGQESFNLLPFNECNGFVVADEEIEMMEKGTMVKVYYF